MRIGLISVDKTKFPNLALMKLSGFHKSMGHEVEWFKESEIYDIVYKSKVFTYTDDFDDSRIFSSRIIKGGSGYDNINQIPDESVIPDYSIYGIDGISYGFITRGCIRKCAWCIVPKVEGKIRPYMTIEQIANGNKNVILMDNNVLASEFGLAQIEDAIRLRLKVDFNQGLDSRLISKDIEIVKLLSRLKWLSPLRMACDSMEMMDSVGEASCLLRENNCTPRNYSVYVLLTDLNDSYDRINFCKSLKLDAFAQPYRDFTKNQIIPKWQSDMARYTNIKSIYKTIDFKDYMPRKNFKCSEYFNN